MQKDVLAQSQDHFEISRPHPSQTTLCLTRKSAHTAAPTAVLDSLQFIVALLSFIGPIFASTTHAEHRFSQPSIKAGGHKYIKYYVCIGSELAYNNDTTKQSLACFWSFFFFCGF